MILITYNQIHHICEIKLLDKLNIRKLEQKNKTSVVTTRSINYHININHNILSYLSLTILIYKQWGDINIKYTSLYLL